MNLEAEAMISTWEEAVVWDGKDGRENVFKWIERVYTDTNSGDSKIGLSGF